MASTTNRHTTIDRFDPRDQDIIKAFAAIMGEPDFSPFTRRSERSLRQRLIEFGQTGDIDDPPRWLPAAFTEKNVSTFLDHRLEQAKYAIFVELLGFDEASMIREFTRGAREINKHLAGDLDKWLQNMSDHVVTMFSANARQRRLVEWLAFTDWGADAARQALRDYRRAEYTASLEAFKTMESAMHRRTRARATDQFISPDMFVVLASYLIQGQLQNERIGDWNDELWGPGRTAMGRGVTAFMAWVLCRHEDDPTIHDFLDSLQRGTPVSWGRSDDRQ